MTITVNVALKLSPEMKYVPDGELVCSVRSAILDGWCVSVNVLGETGRYLLNWFSDFSKVVLSVGKIASGWPKRRIFRHCRIRTVRNAIQCKRVRALRL